MAKPMRLPVLWGWLGLPQSSHPEKTLMLLDQWLHNFQVTILEELNSSEPQYIICKMGKDLTRPSLGGHWCVNSKPRRASGSRLPASDVAPSPHRRLILATPTPAASPITSDGQGT